MDGFHCSDVVAFLPSRAVLSARTGNWCMLASTRSGTRRHDMAMGVIPCHSQSFRHSGVPLAEDCLPSCQCGSGAPGVHEDVAPKVVSAEVANWQVCLRVQKGLGPKDNDESMLYWHQDGIKFQDQKESYFPFTDFGDILVLAGAIAGSQRTQVGGAQHVSWIWRSAKF